MKKLLLTATLGLLTVFANSSSLVNANLSQTKLIDTNNTTKSLGENEVQQVTTEAEIIAAFANGGDVKMMNDIAITSSLVIAAGKTVNLDLNGCVLMADSGKTINGGIIDVKGSLVLDDSNKTTEHKGTIANTGDYPGLWTYDGSGNDIIKGGIITGGSAFSYSGSGIRCEQYATFVMNAGTIAGNKTLKDASMEGAGVFLDGKNQSVTSFTMNGGTISNNVSQYHAGGVAVSNGASFTMNNGKILANYSKFTGAGVYATSSGYNNSSSFTMKNGIVADNVVTDGPSSGFKGAGAGVYVTDSYFAMEGGTISGNKSPMNGSGVCIQGSSSKNSTFEMTGGEIVNNEVIGSSYYGGGIYVKNYVDATFGGSARVQGNSSNGMVDNVYLDLETAYKKGVEIDSPDSSMSVGITTNSEPTLANPVQFTTNGTESDVKYFSSDNYKHAVEYNSGGYLQLTKPSDLNIKLTEDTYISEPMTFDSEQNVTLDLNGHAIIMTGKGDAIKFTDSSKKLIIKDSIPTTKHKGYVDDTGLWHIGEGTGKEVTIEGGLITGSDEGHGVNVTAETFTMEGGTIIGNGYTTLDGGGVNVGTKTKFNMTGGAIRYNRGNYGAGVYNSGTFTMTGGTIANNTSKDTGGGVYINSGSFIMEGGTINDNASATSGGGVNVKLDATFNMKGGTITNNKSVISGAGVNSYGTFTMEGGTISNNTSSASNSTGSGVNVTTGKFNMKAGTITGNTGASAGAGVNVTDGTFIMEGGTISDNTSTISGGGVNISASATFNMKGGTISDNTSTASGGGIDNSGTFTMEAGTISHNTSSESNSAGGGVFNNGSFEMTGGTISDNKAYVGGGLYIADNKKVTLGGTAKIINNFLPVSTELKSMNNVQCGNSAAISLGTESKAPAQGMLIGINGEISISSSDDVSGYFFSDAQDKCIQFINDKLVVSDIPTGSHKLSVEYYENGFVSVPEISKAGEKVIVTAESTEKGYNLANLKYSSDGIEYIDITKDKCFTMPDAPVTIVATFDLEVASISLTNEPSKTTYERGEEFDPTGAEITVTYSAGGTKTFPVTKDMVSGYDKNKAGEQELTVTYAEKTDTFKVTVNPSVVEDISWEHAPTKVKYKVGEELNLTGVKIKVTYVGHYVDPDIIDVTKDMVSGYDKNKVGKQTVTVTYEEKTLTFEVTVVKNPDPPTPPTPEEDSGLSAGAIAGIAAGGVVALGGLIWLIIVLAKKKKKKDDEKPVAKSTISKPTKTVKPTQKAKPVTKSTKVTKPVKKAKPISKAKTTTKKTSKKKK